MECIHYELLTSFIVFNIQVGGVTKVVLIDCDESSMQKTLQDRAASTPDRSDDNPAAISARLHYYKYNTLPVVAHYDDMDKLYIVSILGYK